MPQQLQKPINPLIQWQPAEHNISCGQVQLSLPEVRLALGFQVNRLGLCLRFRLGFRCNRLSVELAVDPHPWRFTCCSTLIGVAVQQGQAVQDLLRDLSIKLARGFNYLAQVLSGNKGPHQVFPGLILPLKLASPGPGPQV